MNRAEVTLLADVKEKPVQWLWAARIPLGMLTIFDGDPGIGKSTVLIDLAARLSRGDGMPDGSAGPGAAGTVLLTAEDDLARVVRPRLGAAGADLSRIATAAVMDRGESREPCITSGDLPAVEEAIHAVGAKLVIVDPLMAYLPSEVNSNRDQDVRRALVRLRDLAEKTGAAVVVVRHLNKAMGGPALYRGGGSIGIIGAARSGLLLAADPSRPESGRVLAVVKSNLARRAPSLRIELVQEGDDFARVLWGEPCDLSATQLLSSGDRPERRGPRNEAIRFLRDLLAEGPMPAREVEGRAAEQGISNETLRRARRELGVVPGKQGRPSDSDQHWSWSLPDGAGATLEGVHRNGDPLRAGAQESEVGTPSTPKVVTPVVDLLRVTKLETPSDSQSFSKEVTSSESPTASEPTNSLGSPCDLLREEPHGRRSGEALGPEEGHLDKSDQLRACGDATPSVQADPVCPLCGGRTLSWSWGAACTRCHSRLAGNAAHSGAVEAVLRSEVARG